MYPVTRSLDANGEVATMIWRHCRTLYAFIALVLGWVALALLTLVTQASIASAQTTVPGTATPEPTAEPRTPCEVGTVGEYHETTGCTAISQVITTTSLVNNTRIACVPQPMSPNGQLSCAVLYGRSDGGSVVFANPAPAVPGCVNMQRRPYPLDLVNAQRGDDAGIKFTGVITPDVTLLNTKDHISLEFALPGAVADTAVMGPWQYPLGNVGGARFVANDSATFAVNLGGVQFPAVNRLNAQIVAYIESGSSLTLSLGANGSNRNGMILETALALDDVLTLRFRRSSVVTGNTLRIVDAGPAVDGTHDLPAFALHVGSPWTMAVRIRYTVYTSQRIGNYTHYVPAGSGPQEVIALFRTIPYQRFRVWDGQQATPGSGAGAPAPCTNLPSTGFIAIPVAQGQAILTNR